MIIVPIKLEGNPLKITTHSNNTTIGSVADHHATKFVFTRPAENAADSLVLSLAGGGDVLKQIHLETENEFLLPDLFTQSTILRMQAAFERNGVSIAHSNIVLFYLRDSLCRSDQETVPPLKILSEMTQKTITDVSIDGNLLNFHNLTGETVGCVSLPRLAIATEAVAGAVKSSADDLKISVSPDGTMSMNHLSDAINKINSALEQKEDIGALAEVEAYIGYADDIYGLEADFQNNTFTRLAGSVGKTGGADFDSVGAFGGRRRCNVTNDGTITAYYGDAFYTETGALAQDVTVGSATYPAGTLVQTMVYQPKFFYKMVPLKLEPIAGSIGYHIRKARYYVSDTPMPGFKVHPWFIVDGKELPYRLTSAYEGCLYDISENTYILDDAGVGNFTVSTGDMLSSIASAKPISGLHQNLTRRNCGILAENRGPGWTQQTIQGVSAMQLLMAIEYGAFDVQNAIGRGVVDKKDDNATNMAETTGQTSALGNASGMAPGTNGLASVAYRGEENPWGNVWGFVDGANIWGDGTLRGGIPFISNNAFAEAVRNGKYVGAGFSLANTKGYVSAFGYGNPDFDWLFMASECAGTSDFPVGDYTWVTPDLNDYRIIPFGAHWGAGTQAGIFNIAAHNAITSRNRVNNGRLEFAPVTTAYL